MKKEFKMKKMLALVMALSVVATSAVNFSVFAVTSEEKTINLTLNPNSPSYTLTIPAAVNLTEKTGKDDQGKFYATNEGKGDSISVSDMNQVESVKISLSGSTYDNGNGKAAIKANEGEDTKALTITLDGNELSLNGEGEAFEGDGIITKSLSIETEEYANQISETYTGTLTFTATATEVEPS